MKSYSAIDKFLHNLVFRNKIINRSLFEIEKIMYSRKKDINNQSHLFITGLPRSGTTSLLNFLFSSNEYASLSYRNMPFLLSPNLSKLFNKKNIPLKERLHADGIKFDINSPEALDEIFFENDEKFIANELINYIELILLSENKNKYLSKNNLNYKRIDLIHSILINSIFLISIRDPLQQAFSLLKQHIHFVELQKKDYFIKQYMDFLGHREFGLNHKPWSKPINYKNLNDINYWLEQWLFFYQNMFEKYSSYNNCHFVIYENLSHPNYVRSFIKKINFNNLDKLNLNYFKNSNKKKINIDYDKNLYMLAKNIYQKYIN
jgi:hypothetical protein